MNTNEIIRKRIEEARQKIKTETETSRRAADEKLKRLIKEELGIEVEVSGNAYTLPDTDIELSSVWYDDDLRATRPGLSHHTVHNGWDSITSLLTLDTSAIKDAILSCPFSGHDCLEQCALRFNNHCAFYVIAEMADYWGELNT